MGKIHKKFLGFLGSNSASQGQTFTPNSDPSADYLSARDIKGQPSEFQRRSSTNLPELAHSNGLISPPWENKHQYSRTMEENYTSGHQDLRFESQGFAQDGYPQQIVNGNIPSFALEEDYCRDQKLQVQQIHNRVEWQQQQQTMANRNPVSAQIPQTSLDTHSSTSALNLFTNRRTALEHMFSFSTTQQIFILVFVLMLISIVFFAVLTTVFSFIRESTQYIITAFTLSLGAYGFLNWNKTSGETEVSKLEVQVKVEHFKAERAETELLKQLKWERGTSGSGYRKEVKRLEYPDTQRGFDDTQRGFYDTQKSFDGRWNRTNYGFSRVEILKVD